MDKKYSMFPSGKIVAIGEDGIPKKASKGEEISYLISLLPKTYKDEKIEKVMFDPEDGCVHGKTASYHIKKKVVAQQSTNKTEPVDGSQKVKETKVPRSKEKAKPETSSIVEDRPDVGKPTDVRQDGYQRGKGGEDLHTDVVPRSKSNSGLKGSNKTDFEVEEADKATSGNPDSYVQDFTKSEKPAAAGSEANHAAGTEIEIRSDQEIYENLKLSAKDDDKCSKCECDPCKCKKDDKEDDKDDDKEDKKDDDKDDKKDKKKGKLPPWLDKYNKDEEKEASVDAEELKEVQAEVLEKDKEISTLRLKAGRIKEATVYALTLLKLNPAKYSDPDTFTEFINSTAEVMSVEAIKTASEETKILLAEKQRINKSVIKEAAVEGPNSGDSGIVTIINTIDPDEGRFEKEVSSDDLKQILMSGTRLGRAMEDYETYVPSEPK